MNTIREGFCTTLAKTETLTRVFFDALTAPEHEVIELQQIGIYAK